MSETDPTKEASDFGKRLQICLTKVQKSPSDLAKKIGHSPSTVTRNIAGDSRPTTKTVAKYIEAFRDWSLEVPEQFFFVPWEYIGFFDPKRTEYPSVVGGGR